MFRRDAVDHHVRRLGRRQCRRASRARSVSGMRSAYAFGNLAFVLFSRRRIHYLKISLREFITMIDIGIIADARAAHATRIDRCVNERTNRQTQSNCRFVRNLLDWFVLLDLTDAVCLCHPSFLRTDTTSTDCELKDKYGFINFYLF